MKTLFVFITFFLCSISQSQANLAEDSLRVILQTAAQLQNAGQTPVAVVDIDGTLLNNESRTLAIFEDFASQSEILTEFPAETRKIRELTLHDIRYSIEETLQQIEVRSEPFLKKLKTFWGRHFFSNQYLNKDEPVAGAAYFIQELHRAGVFIIYLTGRDRPKMEIGTELALVKSGFPRDSWTRLFMKPHFKINDLIFKTEALKEIDSLGQVVAVFENEPINLDMLVKKYPRAISVLLLTSHSNRMPLEALDPSVNLLPNFNLSDEEIPSATSASSL